MNNWMKNFERRKDEQRENELNRQLKKLLDLLDEVYKREDRMKVLEKIIYVYDELKKEFYDYNDSDYFIKKEELKKIRFQIKKEEYMNSKESQSWNEYREEELKEEIEDEER